MNRHRLNSSNKGKSQFLYDVDSDKAVLDAAAYADKFNLWGGSDHGNKAKIYVVKVVFYHYVFCKEDSAKEIENVFGDEIVIKVEKDFDAKKWFIDEKRFNRDLSNISWIVQDEVLDIREFSINELWYATI